MGLIARAVYDSSRQYITPLSLAVSMYACLTTLLVILGLTSVTCGNDAAVKEFVYPDPVVFRVAGKAEFQVRYAPEQPSPAGPNGRISAICVEVRPEKRDRANAYTTWCYPFERHIFSGSTVPRKPVIAKRDSDHVAVAFIVFGKLIFRELEFRKEKADVSTEIRKFKEMSKRHAAGGVGTFELPPKGEPVSRQVEVPSQAATGYSKFLIEDILRPRLTENERGFASLERLEWKRDEWIAHLKVAAPGGTKLVKVVLRKRPKCWTAEAISAAAVRPRD